MQEAGEAVCPVCQTVIYANSHHAFAEFCEEIFRQEDVDGAKIEFEKKDRLREEGAKNLVKLEAEFSGLRGKVRDGLREFHEIKLEEFDKMENGFREFHEIGNRAGGIVGVQLYCHVALLCLDYSFHCLRCFMRINGIFPVDATHYFKIPVCRIR